MLDLKQRTILFATSVGKLILKLPNNVLNHAHVSQLVRSSSSVGANYRAVRKTKSDADFLNKLKIVEKEADESVYFLELLLEFNNKFKEEISGLITEGTEILKIIVSSINTIRLRISKKD